MKSETWHDAIIYLREMALMTERFAAVQDRQDYMGEAKASRDLAKAYFVAAKALQLLEQEKCMTSANP